MGGLAKGLLMRDGESIVARWGSIFDRLGIPRVLVGGREREYAALGWRSIADDPRATGPLAGVLSLLEEAGEGSAIVVGCDMPWVEIELLQRLIAAPPAPIVAPRGAAGWEPLLARYDAARVLPIARAQASAGGMSLQALLDRAGAAELVLDEHERKQLRDWDTPEDLP